MMEAAKFARPYAQAIFDLAQSQGEASLQAWQSDLSVLSSAVENSAFTSFVHNPKTAPAQLEQLLLPLVKGVPEAEFKRFLSLLTQNHRLQSLPAIAEQYADLFQAYKHQTTAHIASAFPLSEQQVKELLPLLEKKFARKLVPVVHTVPALIGGISVRVGDEVWDTSVRAQLDNLKQALA